MEVHNTLCKMFTPVQVRWFTLFITDNDRIEIHNFQWGLTNTVVMFIPKVYCLALNIIIKPI